MTTHFQLTLTVLLIIVVFTSVVHTAPTKTGNGEEKQVFDEVQQLDSLRNEHRFENNQEKKDSPEVTSLPGTSDSSSVAETSSGSNQKAVNMNAIFRHRGITEAKKKQVDWQAPKQNSNYNKFSGVQYSPADLAEYVFRTGDEEGVALAVEELVREGMMGRTDAINYLQDVKEALIYMQEQYEKARKLEEMRTRAFPKPQVNQQRLMQMPREQFVSQMDSEKRKSKVPLPNTRSSSTLAPEQQSLSLSTSAPELSANTAVSTAEVPAPKNEKSEKMLLSIKTIKGSIDKKEQRENPSQTQQTLEEVIYQLARDVFAQSISREDESAEESLSRLISFLESRVGNREIPVEIKEKVLEIMSKALFDTLRMYPDVSNNNEMVPQINDNSNMRFQGQEPLNFSSDKRQDTVVQKSTATGPKNKITSDLIALHNSNNPLTNHSKRA